MDSPFCKAQQLVDKAKVAGGKITSALFDSQLHTGSYVRLSRAVNLKVGKLLRPAMAQWDHRDPRWLVSELGANGSNVNGWHWEEKNKMGWCKQKLHELTEGVETDMDPTLGYAKLLGVKELTGEAYLTRRKGNKMLAVFDLCITLDWQGKLAAEDAEISGQVTITEFSLGSEQDEYVLVVTSDKEDEKYSCLVDAVKRLQPRMLQILSRFEEELKLLQQ